MSNFLRPNKNAKIVLVADKPKLTVSGYRGIWGKDLDEQITFEYARAFARVIKNGKIIVGRDARKTGSQMLAAISEALKQEGIEVVDAGIIPTPSILLLVRKLKFDGGIIITGSHNPSEYNGIKFVMSTGLFASQDEIVEIEKSKASLNEIKYTLSQISKSPDNKEFRKKHIEEIIKNVDAELIRSKKFKVVLDPINSAGAVITKELLLELGCETFIINEEQTGDFAHPPEPRVENVGEISKEVLKNKCDIGFVQDPDADRLLVITDKGEVLSEEYTLALAVKNVLEKNPSDIVVNMSTSNLSADIAKKYNVKTHHTKVGESNVVALIRSLGANIGGEGNGGVIYPKINEARDSLVGIALILELMARENKKIVDIIAEFPKYIMRKEKVSFSRSLPELYDKLKIQFAGSRVNQADGLRLDFENSSWVHIRPSNTEPVVRIIGEARGQTTLDALFAKVMLTLSAK